MKKEKVQPIISFQSLEQWEQWLSQNYSNDSGIWIRFYKKNSGVKTISYDEALEVALCYGWIDSQAKKFDEKSYFQRFSQRRTKSVWSKINTQRIENLIRKGKMKPSGLKVVDEAKKDGRWVSAYDSPKNTKIPDDFLAKLNKNKIAKQMFDSLNKSNVYAISWRLQTAKKEETRKKRMDAIINLLSKGEKFHD